MLTSSMNGTMYTYEMAPCFTMMENELFDVMRKNIGWEFVDGVLTPGGSFANFYAMVVARHHKFPEVKKKGVVAFPPMKIFSSEHSHYSMEKAAITLGLGTDSVIKVPCTKNGEMIPEELEKLIKESQERGEAPFMINATVGTTVVATVDPIAEIAPIAKKYGLWLHADAALGGPAFFKTERNYRVKGSEHLDSITWDPHKALQVPLQCSLFITKHDSVMAASNSMNAPYLFHKDRTNYSPTLDTGDKTLQCGRHIDIFKLWVYLKSRGINQIIADANKCYSNAKALEDYIKKNSDRWILCYDVVLYNVCYYYIPKVMNDCKPETEDEKELYYKQLGRVIVEIKKKQVDGGKVMIGYAKTVNYKHPFLRMVCTNPNNSPEELIAEMELLAQYGEEAAKELGIKT